MWKTMEILNSGTRYQPRATIASGWRLKAVSAGLVGVALLLVLAPAAQAASAGSTSLTLKAPYVGTTSYASRSVSVSWCGGANIGHGPSFDPATGRLGFSLKSHASACSPLFGDSASAYASETITVPISAFTGTNVIHAKWSINANLWSGIGSASCTLQNTTFSECYSSSYAEISGYGYLYDATNGSYYSASNYWDGTSTSSSFFASCYNGNCTSTLSGNAHLALATSFDWRFHATGLVASHSYVLEFSWYGEVYSYDGAYLGTLSEASEGSSLTMVGPGLGATLDWISIK
jgi:hypothetical protein